MFRARLTKMVFEIKEYVYMMCSRYMTNSVCIVYKKAKQSRYRPELAQRVDRIIALPFCDPGARRGWVVITTPRPLYPRERSGAHCTEGWVGPRAGLDVCEKSHSYRDSIPGPSSP
jgi:hypothetical protein